MVFPEVFAPFIEQSPVSVMFRATLEKVLAAERLNGIFQNTAQRQYCQTLAFSTCVDLLGLVVARIRPSLHAAYQVRRGQIAVSIQAVYQKVAGIEPAVSEALVRETAQEMSRLLAPMQAPRPSPLPGFEVRIADGNSLAGTQHRLKELRHLGDAALPGQTLAVLNPQQTQIEAVVACEDGHANQKPLMIRLLPLVQPNQCWIADRDFSTPDFLGGVAQRQAYFLVRQHGGLKGQLVGPRRRVGRIATGMVYEQALELPLHHGPPIRVRRITIELDQPTRDGETVLHLLTNLPARIGACQAARAYQDRWQIEAAFHKLTLVLRCELNTLGYPDAALFGFCLAVVMYNALNVVLTALRAAHPAIQKRRDRTGKPVKLSFYYLADEIAGVSRGMAIAIGAETWTETFAGQTSSAMATILLDLARKVHLDRFFANPSSLKKRKKRRPMHKSHVATQRILEARKRNLGHERRQ